MRVDTRAYLRPVTEHLAVSSVGDQLLGELEGEHVSGVARKHPLGAINLRLEVHLSDCWVQVVHDHQHYGGSLTRTAWILIDGVSPGEGGREGGGWLLSHLTGNKEFTRLLGLVSFSPMQQRV